MAERLHGLIIDSPIVDMVEFRWRDPAGATDHIDEKGKRRSVDRSGGDPNRSWQKSQDQANDILEPTPKSSGPTERQQKHDERQQEYIRDGE